MIELLECPFCASQKVEKQRATTIAGEFHNWKIWCLECNCRTGPETSLSNAISKWNMRRVNPEKPPTGESRKVTNES